MRPLRAQATESSLDVDGESELDLGQLYRVHARTLAARLRRKFGAEAAEDLVQEAFARMSRLADLRKVRHPKALLTRIAVNVALDEKRANRGAQLVELEAAGAAAQLALLDDQSETLLLKQIILQLPDPLRDIFILSRFGGMTYDQIAQQYGLSVKTVEWRMSKALAFCAARLEN